MSSSDSSSTDSWDSDADSWASSSDSWSDDSDSSIYLRAVAAQVAAAVALADGSESESSEGEEDDTWQRRPTRPQTLADVEELLPNRLFVHELRFTPEQFTYLCTKLGVPERMPTEEQRAASSTLRKIKQLNGRVVFALTVSRLAHPTPVQGQMESKWGFHRSEITKYTGACIAWLMDEWSHLLTLTGGRVGPRAAEYAEAIGKKLDLDDPAGNRVIGFIDGVFVYTCKPRLFQESMYSGYYKGHGYKFQAVVAPNGLIEDLYGPEPGRHHDIYLWQQSQVGREMETLPNHPAGRYVLYGDSAYRKPRARRHVAVAYPRHLPLTPSQRELNRLFNRARVVVEWAFGHVYALFPLLRFPNLLRTGQSAVGDWYMAACLLYNFRTCLNRGNQTSLFFDIVPPTLSEYMDAPRPGVGRYDHVVEAYEVIVNAYPQLG